tara:strand:+ start:8862 stop:9302 length:441 start_codon:yes stop_codon:yes gene_type:complete
MAYKTKFNPTNTKKYIGNPSNIICRSTWERKLCKYMDMNSNVIRWGSEEIIVPYVSPVDNKIHRYYPDFIAEIKDNKNEVSTFLIEVKPQKQTVVPKKGKKRARTYQNEIMTYAVNQEKWKSATKFCSEKGWKFKILTEKDLFKGT